MFALMSDGQWRTLREIEAATSYPQASISARLRDYTKEKFEPQFGKYTRESRRRTEGQYEYRLVKEAV